MSQFLLTESVIIILLAIVTLVAIFVRRLRIPYTVALVLIGLLIASQPILKFGLIPQLILALFIPPLVFVAAFHCYVTAIMRPPSKKCCPLPAHRPKKITIFPDAYDPHA